jgi:hypothetical protein
MSDRRRRAKVLLRLSGVGDFREELGQPLHLSGKRDEQVRRLQEALTRRGAPDHCHVMAQDDAVDGREMPLRDAIEECIDDGGALLVCLPGRLAVLLPEPPDLPVVFERADCSAR